MKPSISLLSQQSSISSHRECRKCNYLSRNYGETTEIIKEKISIDWSLGASPQRSKILVLSVRIAGRNTQKKEERNISLILHFQTFFTWHLLGITYKCREDEVGTNPHSITTNTCATMSTRRQQTRSRIKWCPLATNILLIRICAKPTSLLYH